MMSFLLLIFVNYVSFSNAWSFTGSSDNFYNYSSKMGVGLSGYMAAFGDFNADRATDIFVLDKVNGVQQVDVILMAKDLQNKPRRMNLFQDSTNSIVNVVAGDFDGDSVLDLVIYRGGPGAYSVQIAYGLKDRSGVMTPTLLMNGTTFMAQPLHLDWNADMIGDLFCQQSQTSFIVLKGQAGQTFNIEIFTINNPDMSSLLYSKFLDLDQDGNADLLLMGRTKDKRISIMSFMKRGQKFVYSNSYTSDPGVTPLLIGQGVVGDFTLSGSVQMVVPVCDTLSCSQSSLLTCILSNLTCVQRPISMTLGSDQMTFIPGKTISKLSLAVPELAPMSCGDLHLSGHLECLVLVTKASDPRLSSVVIMVSDKNMNFTLKRVEGADALFSGAAQVAVFDLLEDGIPDIITVTAQAQSGLIAPLFHDSPNDQYFLKVMVLNGLCWSPDNCPGGNLPFGIPLPGISVSYSTESADGGTQVSISSLCPESDFTSLQLPYAHFGLGAFANYVEKLYIKLPYINVSRQHTVSFIVPKTQIVIIPHPLDDPSLWTNKLFLEPFHNMKVIYVAAALLGTFFIVTIVACVLQYLEVRVDRLEKMQESQKFHFDAM